MIIVNEILTSWCSFKEPIKIDELIKLANQFKGALVIEMEKMTTTVIFESKKISLSFEAQK